MYAVYNTVYHMCSMRAPALGSALTLRLAASAALTVLETARRSCCAFSSRSSSEDLLLAREALTLGVTGGKQLKSHWVRGEAQRAQCQNVCNVSLCGHNSEKECPNGVI